MNTHQMSFVRGKTKPVSEEMGDKLLKIDGFTSTMNTDAKAELKKNIDRETTEKSKLDSGIVYINNDEEVVALRQKLAEIEESDIVQQFTLDIDRLNKELASSKKEIAELTAEGKQKSILVSELTEELEQLTKPKDNGSK